MPRRSFLFKYRAAGTQATGRAPAFSDSGRNRRTASRKCNTTSADPSRPVLIGLRRADPDVRSN